MLHTQRIVVPEESRPRLREIVDLNLQAYRLVRQVVDLLFSSPSEVGVAAELVGVKETESDRAERALIYDVFRSDLQKCDMMLMRELIDRVGAISDSAEKVARRLEIISLKRRI